jgi:poly-gamma-glutamate synthesis protein (capsule biosynthesis protein)
LDEIVRLRPLVDYLVVFPHWGEEYKKKPHVEQIRLARAWSDAGADVIIGAHPHVIQQITRRTTTDGRAVPIFYSLGNFIFDQYFSFDTTHGIAVEIELPLIQKTQKISDSKASTTPALHEIAKYAQYKILPFSSVGTKVSIPSSTSTARIFEDIEKVSGTSTWEWLKK